MKNIKYIHDDPAKGILYDWDFIRKEFKKLGVPSHVYTPLCAPFEKDVHLFVNMSDRSVGKTSNWLLLGMIMNKHYGTILHYIRQREDMITPKALKDLFSTLVDYRPDDEHNYIELLTDGKYNNVYYHARRWYYCRTDDGEIIDDCKDFFMFCASIDKNENLKSSYNSPRGDFILFDEFIGKYYSPNEFVYFCDLVKTIIRDRISPIIVFSANTIDKNSQYFNELEIYDRVQTLQQGESDICTSSGGSKVYVEIVGQNVERKKRRSLVNKLFFGFKNPLLASITGADWAVKYYPHIPPAKKTQFRDGENVEYYAQNIYIVHNGKIVRLDIVDNEKRGICIYCHWATPSEFQDDAYIMTAGEVLDRRYHFKFGDLSRPLPKFVWKLYSRNLFFFATNDIGAFLENYVHYCNNLE